ncbi:MAG: hypothetical protein CL959_01785 [Euryarchaeota archaeon]|nr:hypothetical protein [Euryarchaeota archaeon]|tara:strand:- start:794 stop:997 length:204 start_codon:yes stop_codon:yes gene_type:complete
MLSYFRSLLELRALDKTKTYRVFYTTIDGDFFLEAFVDAPSAYEAAREFDTRFEFFYYRRRGMPTPV